MRGFCRTGLQQIPLCCLLKTTFFPFLACPWGNSAQVRDHHAAGALRSQPKAVDGGHGREGAGECSWSCSQLECAAEQCPLPAGAARDQCCTITTGSMLFPQLPLGILGLPLKSRDVPLLCQPFAKPTFPELVRSHSCSSLLAGNDVLPVPAFSHLFRAVTVHPTPVFSHLSVPTGVPFLQSEQSSESCGFPTGQRISLAIGAPLKYREAAENP